MAFKPVFNFRAITILRAFFLNALLIGVTTALTIEVRRIFDTNPFTKDLPDRPHKLVATAIASVTIGFTGYVICRYLFGLGGAMLAPFKPYKNFL